VALERSLTELLQGRSFEGLNDIMPPTFNEFAVREHNNIIDHFIDSTGVVSWKFFSEVSDYEFSQWDFSGTTEQEFNYLIDILEELGKEVYIADYEELGCKACRILVPEYSEIYLSEDLIWDNNNQALTYREDILNIHSLDKKALKKLITNLEESELDDNMPISELIGVSFDENSPWGQLTIGELKCLGFLAMGKTEDAKDIVESLMAFNDFTATRKRFYQVLNIILDIEINDELELDDYLPNLTRMFGEEVIKNTTASVTGEIKFFGLTKTNMKLEGLEKHQMLIDSYKKLLTVRREY